MPITPVPPSAVDPVAQVVAALEAATATLAASALTLADKGSWLTSTAYAVGDVVTQAGQRYCCRTAHTSGTFATDLAASKWVSLDAVVAVATSRQVIAGTGLTGGGDLSADRTLAVSYGTTSGTSAQGTDTRITGALQAANNLSEVTAASARTNLGLGSAAVISATAGGDLSGTLPSPTVAKVNGVGVTGTPAAGQIPTATGSAAATWQTPTSAVLALGNVTGTATVTMAGQYVTATLTGNTTFVFPSPTSGKAYTFTLEAAQDGTGGRSITWPGSVTWPGGAAPTLSTSASAVSILQFTSRDGGTTWYGSPQSIPPAVNGTPETVNAQATAGSAQTIPDPTTATINYLTLTAATCTLTFPTAAAGKSFSLLLKQDGTGGRLVSWPTITWIGSSSTAPTLSTGASKQDVFTLMCVDGSTWLGMYGGGS